MVSGASAKNWLTAWATAARHVVACIVKLSVFWLRMITKFMGVE